MSTRIAWTNSTALSALHAAARLALHGRLADLRLQEAIAEPVEAIVERLQLEEIDAQRFWWHCLLAGREAAPSELKLAQGLRAAGCAELLADTMAAAIAGRLADIRLAVQELYPRLGEQLPLRAGPLRELWDARGPGLLRYMGKASHPDLLPKRASIFLVHPAAGGAGSAVASEGWGWIEAVLTNPVPSLPEVLRVAWLLACLGFGHPEANRLVAAERLPRVASIAAVPIVLEAAHEVELIDRPSVLLGTALRAWEIEADEELLLRWWSQQREGAVPFAVGLKALDRMLES